MTAPPPGLLAVGPVVVLSRDAARAAAQGLLIAVRARRLSGYSTAHLEPIARALLTAAGQSDDRDTGGAQPEHMQIAPSMPIEDAAERLGLSRRQTRRLAPRLGGRLIGGRWLVDPEAVAEHLDGKRG